MDDGSRDWSDVLHKIDKVLDHTDQEKNRGLSNIVKHNICEGRGYKDVY
jgi:hypothetical protein